MAQQWNGPSAAILYQAYDWNSTLTNGTAFYASYTQDLISYLHSVGISHAWLPPPANSGVGSAGNQGYLPRELGVLDSAYGTKNELQSLVQRLQGSGIGTVYDAVFNHRIGAVGYCGFNNPNWPSTFVAHDDDSCVATSVNPDGCQNPLSIPPSNGCGAQNDTGESIPYARDMNMADPAVVKAYQEYQCQLRATGGNNTAFDGSGANGIPYAGTRFDFVRGYSKDALNKFATTWNQGQCSTIAPEFTYDAQLPNQSFCVGENYPGLFYQSCDADTLAKFLNELNTYAGDVSCGLFDFVTKKALSCAINDNKFDLLSASGKPPGLIGASPLKAVTFVDNHDTGDSDHFGGGQRLMPFRYTGDDTAYVSQLAMANAYIFTHPGVPSVYYPHLLRPSFGDLNSIVASLASMRTKVGIKSNAAVAICQASSTNGNVYAAYINPDPTKSNLYTIAVQLGETNWWCPTFATSSSSCAGTVLLKGPKFTIWQSDSGVTDAVSACSQAPTPTVTFTVSPTPTGSAKPVLPVQVLSFQYLNGVFSGFIYVQNLAFAKTVNVIYVDSGSNSHTIAATYQQAVTLYPDYDLFQFSASVPSVTQFFVQYQVNGQTYLDSNNNENYLVSPAPSVSTSPPTSMTTTTKSAATNGTPTPTTPVQLASYSYQNGKLSGQIDIENLAFAKVVTVIYDNGNGIFNNSFRANYLQALPQFPGYELWSFSQDVPAIHAFYIEYQVAGDVYYDSNGGSNYIVPTPTIAPTSSATSTGSTGLPSPTQQVQLTSYSYQNGIFSGQIEVQNIAFAKVVTVFYDSGNGKFDNNITAGYLSSLPQYPGYELWQFSSPVGAIRAFYIQYQVNGSIYYDSNGGSNYIVAQSTTTKTTALASTSAGLPAPTQQVQVVSYQYQDRTFSGQIEVANIAFSKVVTVVYDNGDGTFNNTIAASYLSPLPQFSGFELWQFSAQVASIRAFYVKYEVNGQTFYDSNGGKNLAVSAETTTTTTTTQTTSSSTVQTGNSTRSILTTIAFASTNVTATTRSSATQVATTNATTSSFPLVVGQSTSAQLSSPGIANVGTSSPTSTSAGPSVSSVAIVSMPVEPSSTTISSFGTPVLTTSSAVTGPASANRSSKVVYSQQAVTDNTLMPVYVARPSGSSALPIPTNLFKNSGVAARAALLVSLVFIFLL